MAKAKKTQHSVAAWRKIFGVAAKICAKEKSPGERMAQCIKRVLQEIKEGRRPVPVTA